MKSKIFLIVVVLMGLFATSSFAQLKLNGAGATFPYVIIQNGLMYIIRKPALSLIINPLEAVAELTGN